MLYSEAHIIRVFQSTVYWQEEHVCGDFNKHVSQSVLWVVDFDRQLGDENPSENINETNLCGQKWPNYGIHVGSESLNLTFRKLICGQMMLKIICFLGFGVCCRAYFQRIVALGNPNLLTLLINKFACICEGQSWWFRIT